MVILLPKSDQFESFESALDAQRVNVLLGSLEQREINLTMPRFEFESSFPLKKTLTTLGMPSAFSSDADFSGMAGNRELFIADIVHKAFVSVDEVGTEAAAATAVVVGLTAVPDRPIDVNVDHLFIFLIRDMETNTILFLSRVLNPAI